MDPHLVEDTILELPVTPHPTQILTQSWDTPTGHHSASLISTPAPAHSWQEVKVLNPMKLKCFMKVPEINELK